MTHQKRAAGIVILVLLCCGCMAFVETVIEPPYAIKSLTKVLCFLAVPAAYCLLAKETPADALNLPLRKLPGLLLIGGAIYLVIMLAYAVSSRFFDYGALVANLSGDQNVAGDSFLPVALYISFVNSLIEEVMFRLFGFLLLSRYASRRFAYLFSSIAFAVYHIGMIGQSFPPLLLVLSLLGLAAGGLIFDYVDERYRSMYCSWFIHMFADFAIMTIWFLQL